MEISYDRSSNITLTEDGIHATFDRSYTMDDLDRLTRAQEGTWGGSSISSERSDQSWTLSHTGNWDAATLDFDADDVYTGTGEYDDSRTHNAANELLARDVDSDSTDEYTHVYDAVGNMTDDGESYEYVYDPFGRLREIRDQSSNLVAEYRYNGLGFLISEHADTDDDGDVDGSDRWFHNAYDERWRHVATYREDDTDPKEEYVHHQAGLGGRGGSSYINSVVIRDRDANTAWTSASDGTLEERMFYFQNWRGDLVGMMNAGGYFIERVKYSAYGEPFGLPGGDTDSDGDVDATDVTQVQTWINAAAYDVRADVDLDGDVDATDKSTIQTYYQGTTAGRGVLSGTVDNRRGYAGYTIDSAGLWHVRHRVLDSGLGRWLRRDPLGYVDGMSFYQYVARPIVDVDETGLSTGSSQLLGAGRGFMPGYTGPLPTLCGFTATCSGGDPEEIMGDRKWSTWAQVNMLWTSLYEHSQYLALLLALGFDISADFIAIQPLVSLYALDYFPEAIDCYLLGGGQAALEGTYVNGFQHCALTCESAHAYEAQGMGSAEAAAAALAFMGNKELNDLASNLKGPPNPAWQMAKSNFDMMHNAVGVDVYLSGQPCGEGCYESYLDGAYWNQTGILGQGGLPDCLQ